MDQSQIEEIENYIELNLKSGFKMSQIESMLLEHDYEKDDIEIAKSNLNRCRSRNRVVFILKLMFKLIICFLVLFVIYIFFFNYVVLIIQVLLLLDSLLFVFLIFRIAILFNKVYIPETTLGYYCYIKLQTLKIVRELILVLVKGYKVFFKDDDYISRVLVFLFRFDTAFSFFMTISYAIIYGTLPLV